MSREAKALVILRIFLGSFFVWSGVPKLKASYMNEALPGMLQYLGDQGAISFYKGFLVWALAHAKIFALLTSVGEVAIGLSLILGFLTPIAAIAVIVMCLNYFLATKNLGPAPMGLNLSCVAVGVALLVGRAGRHLSLDSKICPCG